MADQQEPSLPVGSNTERKSVNLLPRYYRTDSNKKFLSATIDQLTQPGTVKKLNGYIGRQNSKAVKANDIFIEASDTDRQSYQLEPAAVIKNEFNNVTFLNDYLDYINQIKVFGGNVDNHERLNQQEFYSWNPHIDWDKFVNFQNYYWLPYGPDPINVQGQQQEIISTYTVNLVDDGDNFAYLMSPDGLTRNPTITLFRGQTYNFEINSPNNPFSFKTSRSKDDLNRYSQGISQNAITSGVITFTVDVEAPDVIFYCSENDANAGGAIQILDIEENTFLDVDKDIIGKKTYSIVTNNISLSNGMKVKFVGNVIPEQYSSGYWYVEGVGSSIKLISDVDLEIISRYSEEKELLFDDTAFDQDPFSTASSFPAKKDYITINRSSVDRNPWSRYNRWFHQDVIIASAQSNNQIANFDQAARANRSIIEFNANLKLYNFGHTAKQDIDLIDTFTTDVFSTIEGSLGYNVDGIDIIDGMRILFTADTDRLVRSKIFKANFIEVIVPARQVAFESSAVDVANNIINFDSEHGLGTNSQVIYLNNGNNNIPGLENRRVYYVFVQSSTKVKLFKDRLLTMPADIFAIGTGTHKLEVFQGKRRQINLVEEPDVDPILNETVLVKQGVINQGLMYFFDGTKWNLGQTKLEINQTPLFDIFDSNGISFSDKTVYDSSTFAGTKLFSYKVGNGANDSVLGFPLTYKNINNVGDIVFDFNLLNDSFEYKVLSTVNTSKTDIGFLKIISDLQNFTFENGWIECEVTNVQPIIRIYKNSGLLNDFPIDVYDDSNDLDDLQVKVLINGINLPKGKYEVLDGVVRKFVRLQDSVTLNDIVTLKCYAKQSKNNKGYYEVPNSLQNNPLNDNLISFTLGEVIDHVGTIVDNLNSFSGSFPGVGNLRDLADVSKFGTRFLQHSGPLNFPLYHLTGKSFNVLKSLEKARLDYGKFKRAFLNAASNNGIQTDPRRHVDHILEQITKDYPKTFPYYLSDMFGFVGSVRFEFTVVEPRVTTYPLSETFSLNNLSNKAIYVYLNEQQLLYGKDYVFGAEPFIDILATLAEGDTIQVFEYESTDGSFCPATPTKLGLYPKYEPKKYIDDTYLTPTEVIQGHDGSITLAYGDYRDDLILELEKRIFNNIKVDYDPDIFNIYDFIPGYDRKTVYNRVEVENVMGAAFFQWTSNINQDYTKQTYWELNDSFTFNYRGNTAPDGTEVPAFWRSIYKWFLDTDRPHTNPWECLGFSIEPTWWREVYGPPPYTKDNQILWDDIKQGIIREPNKPIQVNENFARSILSSGVPVNEVGQLVSPLDANFVNGYIKPTAEGFYIFGDQGPVETAWRRSSYYPFALIQTALLLQPNKVLATCLDRSRIKRNLNNQLVYSTTNLRIRLKDIVVPSTVQSTQRIFTSGLINYIVDYVTSDITSVLDNYINDLQNLKNNLVSKLGGFTSKTKFRLILDSKSPTSAGGVFVPEDNYTIALNTSSPIKKLTYSGIIITKYPDGYEIRGYIPNEPYFTYYPYRLNDRVIRVGGISESFVLWQAEKTYVAGKIVNYNGSFYRVKTTHETTENFDDNLYSRLAELPQTGGREVLLKKQWDFSNPQRLSYGTKFATIQEVTDFIQGYGVYLESEGFEFDQFNANLKTILNWETSIKEFLFWTTQNWAEGSAISLSPGADVLRLANDQAVVNDIRDVFYGYNVFRVDGQVLDTQFANVSREGAGFTLTPVNTNHGIYGAVFYLIQKEHVLLLDNLTLFNDVIYDVEPGYRQERIKVLGYISSSWDGSYNVPGFIFDDAKITNWEAYTDYNLGDTVKYKEFYYSAKSFIPGVEKFDDTNWNRLDSKPEFQLLPNWDYKAEQFTDFYDLDTDNFDSEQQRLAQHLIGYQNRQYLENIIKDDVSQYKFYQGMITEKGTQNVLTKLFDVLSADDQDSLTFNEEWALRVGEYGAVDSYEEIEFRLDEKEFKLNPQPFELVNVKDPSLIDFVYKQTSSELYVKPIGYNNNPWPTDGRKDYLRSPGHVRYEDVKVYANTIQDALENGIEFFNEGDYVWSAFENRDWNVYRFTKNIFTLELVEYSNGTLTITCNKIPDLSVGDVIGIKQTEILDGFYTIKNIIGRKLIIEHTVVGWTGSFEDYNSVLTFKFISSRIANIDDANEHLPPIIKDNELIWADDNGQGLFTTYKNNKIFDREEIENTGATSNHRFGSKVSVTGSGNIAAVTSSSGVLIYNRTGKGTPWLQIQTIVADEGLASATNLNFGLETAFSPDGEWLAIAAPTASFVKSTWAGEFNTTINYSFADVVQVKNVHFSNKNYDFVNDGSTQYDLNRFSEDWVPAYLVNTTSGKNPSVLNEQGYVNIYKKQTSNNRYVLVNSFVSPNPSDYEKFGSKLEFAKQGQEHVLAVSSPGYNSNQGRVYMFRYGTTESDSTVSLWQMDYNRYYVGLYNPLTRYYAGDIVFRASQPGPELSLYPEFLFYRCLADQDPTPMETNPSAWELLEDPNILGYFPHQIVDTSVAFGDLDVYPSINQTVEAVNPGDLFGYDVRMSEDGMKLVISAPAADNANHTNYKGRFRSNQRYNVNDVVYYNGFYYAYNKVFDGTDPVTFIPADWRLLDYKIFDPTAQYNIGEIVYYNNNLWRANTAIYGDGSTINLNTQDWTQVENPIDYPTFDPTAFYNIGDVVYYNGFLWKANTTIIGDGSTINSDTQDWTQIGNPVESNTGKVFVYEYNGEKFVLADTLGAQNLNLNTKERFGESIALSASGNYLAVSSILTDEEQIDQGKVVVFESSTSTFSKTQNLFSVLKEPREKFGTFIDFMNDDRTLVVFSVNGDISSETIFDSKATFFDSGALRIIDVQTDTGRIDIFDRFNSNFIYGESLTSVPSNDINDSYGRTIAVGKNTVLVGASTDNDLEINAGKVYSYTKPNRLCWEDYNVETLIPNTNKIKKAFLYNKFTNKIVTYLDVVDPVQGKIPGPAEQEIRFKTYFDPAFYSVGSSSVNVDTGLNWTSEHKGMLWWDLSTARFLEFAGGDVVYRSTTWNKLYETASIDIYEWVETQLLPSQWNALSGTEEGFSQNISGITRYDDSIYSVKQRYDSVSQSFRNTYYYWVKNPTIVPNVTGRIITASDISRLISDPIGYGYSCLALTGPNSFSLVNVENYLQNTDIILSVQYWIIDNQQQNYHSHWKIVSENSNTSIPQQIENKWIDSLVGKDESNRLLPNLKLPPKLRYGIENRPRQGMFVNRVEAVKEIIERVNSVLAKELIVDEFDLTDLTKAEEPPSIITGIYDKVIDFDTELRFIGIAFLEQAVLVPVIKDGRVVGAEIINPGHGYITTPTVKIIGSGIGAELITVIDTQGKVTGVTVLQSGEGYGSNTELIVRPFSVLVRSDEQTFDRWAIYTWNKKNKIWNKIKNQSYNVNNYWNYIDWYSTGYNQFTKVDYVVENTYELAQLQDFIGAVVKVKNVGSGGWILLEKFAEGTSIDYSLYYKVIARQNGTVQFSKTLYTFKNTSLGFDGPLFDSDIYDVSASEELRIILNSLKDKILVDNLRSEYIKLFFASLRYVFKEQLYVDWAMKTSFVKATHHAGELKQKVTYNSDSLEDFENYVKEVKPYRTKVREYVSAYSSIDNSQSSISDFDLIPYINNNSEIVPVDVKINDDGEIETSYSDIQTYPWKYWYDNIGFSVTSIEIVNSGSGYLRSPIVKIIGGFGSGAEAKAYIANGKVNRIELISKGTGYLKTPTIVLEGGLSATGGVQATAVAIIDESVIRSNKINIKFDRLSKAFFITELEATATFTGTGSRLQWPLQFSPRSVKTVKANMVLPKVTINGADVLRDDFKLTTKKSTAKGYTSYSGLITFEVAPPVGSQIEITYEKDFNHLSAVDRINFYYNPQTGQLGKDLAQLMTGIDFGGVNISGLGFTTSGGWDTLPWVDEGWDGFDATFDDEIVILNADSSQQYEHELNYVPSAGMEINVYLNGRRIDDPYFNFYDGITVQPNGRKVAPDGTYMQTYVGDGINRIIVLPNLTSNPPLNLNEGDVLIFRKSTSDGTFLPDEDSYDTQLSGGNLAYTTATGFAPDDIVLDGEGFITPAHSYAPEEVVPGHIYDTVAIKVFRLPGSGNSKILFKNYICNGVQTAFNIGQYLQTYESVVVKLDNLVLEYGADYTYDYAAKTVTLTTVPNTGQQLSVISFSIASEKLLDSATINADGTSLEYITNAPWPALATDIDDQQAIARLGITVLIDGNETLYEIFKVENGSNYRVGIRFGAPPTVNSLINYIVTGDANSTLSIVKSENLNVDGSTTAFNLSNLIGNRAILSNNVLVIKNGLLLTPGETINFTLQDYVLTYAVPVYKALPLSISPAHIAVTVNGVKLDLVEYSYNTTDNSVTINPTQYVENGILSITILENVDYTISGTTIAFDVAPLASDNIEVISFFLNDTQKIVRSNERFDLTSSLVSGSSTYYEFMRIKGGAVRLYRTVPSDDYVWVAKNKRLLSHSIDFYLDEDLRTIRFVDPLLSTDKLDIITYGNKSISGSYGYMQFKDMLNRVHYKRINKEKVTTLSKDLLQRDKEIHVVDGSVLTNPNINSNLPGIIEINGERIEFFVKTGNVLTQLRRGTLGTGVPTEHKVGAVVIDLGKTETIPYNDQHIVETFVSDGSTRFLPLNYTPVVTDTSWYTETIPSGYKQSNELDVFVGGYRLKKTNYSRFDLSLDYPDSPEGDRQIEADFSVNGTAGLRLTAEAPMNSKIVVIKKIGKIWEDPISEPEIYRNVPAPYGNATFDVYKYDTQYVVNLKLAGSAYNIGDIIILSGILLGGTSPDNDVTITVTTLSFDSTQSITNFTYTGVGQDNGYTHKSLEESNNVVSNFITSVETVWPVYTSSDVQE